MRIQQQPNYLAAALDDALHAATPIESRGRVLEAIGTLVKVTGVQASIGEICELRAADGRTIKAEVVGVQRQSTLLMPFGELAGISVQTQVLHGSRKDTIRSGRGVLGRVLDGFGEPIDGGALPDPARDYPVRQRAPNALERRRIRRPFHTNVRAIDGLLTCGEGQRIGIFAPAGTGKSTLLSMIARGAGAEVIVVGLIGERGREVRDFIEEVLSTQQQARTVIVAATSDRSAAERVKAASVATAIAESFRDEGSSVLLLIDSLTRYARALREIGLAAGEPPTRRGFPASVFTALPQLVERAGQSAHGAITAFYSGLVDDEEGDPIAEELRALLDGHIVLSQALAAADHYPAIDIAASRSRLMTAVTEPAQRAAASELRQLAAKHAAIEMLLQIGEYKPGSDAAADKAIRCQPAIERFLRQQPGESSTPVATQFQLRQAVEAQ